MSNKQRKLVNEGIDDANTKKKATQQYLEPRQKQRNGGSLSTMVLAGMMLFGPTVAASENASLIVGCTD